MCQVFQAVWSSTSQEVQLSPHESPSALFKGAIYNLACALNPLGLGLDSCEYLALCISSFLLSCQSSKPPCSPHRKLLLPRHGNVIILRDSHTFLHMRARKRQSSS